jgi:sensor histidine kinase YesM
MRLVPIKYHVLFWIINRTIYIVFSYIIENYSYLTLEGLFEHLLWLLYLPVNFYITLEMFIPLFIKEFKFKVVLLYLFFLLTAVYSHYFLYIIRDYFMGYPWIFAFPLSSISFILYTNIQLIPLAIVYFYVKKIVLEERQKDIIQQQNNQLQQKILKTQLQALKTKINPDFLDETLEFFQKQAQNSSKELSKAVELLSQMLNYAIKEDDGHGKVDLAKEVIHIQNFIQIQQLRFSNRLNIQFQINGSLHNIQIVPLILITFVENAFKHGALENHENPLNINLTIDNKQLSFYTQNIPRKGPLENAQGIGLANTKKRLQLAYPNKHNLIITQDDKTYQLQLNIKL